MTLLSRSFARRRAIALAGLLLSGLPDAATSLAEAAQGSVIAVESGGGLGEIWHYAADGRLTFRWTGFSNILNVEITDSDRLVVLERGGARFVELDRLGGMHRAGPFRQGNVFQLVVLPSGHFLVAAGKEGAVEIDGSGDVVWRAGPPDPAAEVVSAIRLADGTTLCAARFTAVPLYRIPAGSTRIMPVPLPGVGPFNDLWQRPRLRVLDAATQQVALWYGPWSDWYRFQCKKETLELQSTVPAKGSVSAVAPGRDGMTWVAEAQFEVIQVSPSRVETRHLAVADEIRDIQRADDGGVFVAVERTPDVGRPVDRQPSPDHKPFSWIGLGFWVLGSLFFTGVLQRMARRNATDQGRQGSGLETLSSGPPPDGDQSRRQRWVLFAAAAAVGLALVSLGCARLYQQGSRQALPFLLGGAVLTAVAGQWWSKMICGEVDSWWLKVREARFPSALFLPTWCAVAALMVGALVLWSWRSRGVRQNESISLWVSLQVLCFGLAALSPSRLRLHERRIPWETIVHVAGLLLLASIALSRDLENVPQNVHNDVGSFVDHALRLLEGRVGDFFTSGYAEIPYPGHLPTGLGLLIAGKTVAGSRLGVMLTGLVAVLGTYALGREYKSARLGLFASLLLLSSIPFLHFSRSTPFGEVVAYAVWLLYLLLRAVRMAHPGAWLAFGVVGGWGLFLFYSARVALAGVVVAGILLAFRSYRVTLRRWYGPLLFALGFGITVLPMSVYWRSHPGAFFHRMDTSFSLYAPRTGFHGDVLTRAVGKPFVKTLGMFYTEPDASGQGTLSPAAGPIEAAALSIGLAVVLMDGWGANVACLCWFVTMLLGCGVFAEATPWYTRLVPITPVVSLFTARAVDLLLDLLPRGRQAVKGFATAVVSVALLGLAAKNLKTYLRYERARPATEFTAFGRAALALGPKYQFYCVTFQRTEFTCLNGSFVPYLANLDVRDLRDPIRAMPFPEGRPVAIMLPFQRFVPRPLDPKTLVHEIVLRYPGANLRYVYSVQGGSSPPLGVIAVLSSSAMEGGSMRAGDQR